MDQVATKRTDIRQRKEQVARRRADQKASRRMDQVR
jgi:hypothetical protein